jgi:hypothetical protein
MSGGLCTALHRRLIGLLQAATGGRVMVMIPGSEHYEVMCFFKWQCDVRNNVAKVNSREQLMDGRGRDCFILRDDNLDARGEL